MSTDVPVPSSSVEEAINDTIFNTFVLNIFLFGIYTVVYFGALYTYLAKKSSKNYYVVGAISAAYAIYVAYMGIEWYLVYQGFVRNGQTQDTVFIYLFYSPPWDTLFTNLCNFLLAVIADGLLIWRCFNVWEHSLRAISLPSFLLFTEIVIYLAQIIYSGVVHIKPNEKQASDLNILLAVANFITIATTVLSTLLIAYRIHTVTRKQVIHRGSIAQFNHILEILVQSSAAYALATIALATSTNIPQAQGFDDKRFVPVISAETYSTCIFLFTTVPPEKMRANAKHDKRTTSDIRTIHLTLFSTI
ncbi:hypothetical protein CPB84DRAFT_1792461 [Gymnopilus junonius]|uniref:Uncharacterized protein n=1 Tax=Gymnopilus junonius TaxID=109634 RepID=A0A9P5TH68_GYMJU|nr:hypothetical protein CPB84DRAFT_1792461 [Gymnopilus junonius]